MNERSYYGKTHDPRAEIGRARSSRRMLVTGGGGFIGRAV
ncbi:MAG: hypothetical protein JWO31_1640, partial [Phycisphaerales bacterium]|nr:hypothetical protein [Phycisphaerales bacterium]